MERLEKIADLRKVSFEKFHLFFFDWFHSPLIALEFDLDSTMRILNWVIREVGFFCGNFFFSQKKNTKFKFVTKRSHFLDSNTKRRLRLEMYDRIEMNAWHLILLECSDLRSILSTLVLRYLMREKKNHSVRCGNLLLESRMKFVPKFVWKRKFF